MYPVLFQIGPISVSSLWFFAIVAFVLGNYLFARYALRNKLRLELVVQQSAKIFLLGLIVARITFIVFNFDLFTPLREPSDIIRFLKIWDRGLSMWGAVAGIVFGLYRIAKRHDHDFWAWMDAFLLAAVPSSMLLHIGTFLDGINYGRATDLPWGITFWSAVVRYSVPIHPTQLYALGLTALLSAIIYFVFRKAKDRYPGFIANIGILGLSVIHFSVSFFRGDDTLQIAFIRIPQVLSLSAAVWFTVRMYKHLKIDEELRDFVARITPKRKAANVKELQPIAPAEHTELEDVLHPNEPTLF